MATPLRLNCWVLGEDSTRIFPVEVDRNENVGVLKEAIKEKNPHALNLVDAKGMSPYLSMKTRTFKPKSRA